LDGYTIAFDSSRIGMRDVGTMDMDVVRAGLIVTYNGQQITDESFLSQIYIVGTPMRIQPKTIVVSTGSYEAQYQEGLVLTYDSVQITRGTLAPGHRYEGHADGSQEGVGSSFNTLKSFVIYDANGKDVTDNYDILVQRGLLSVVENS
jgi:hypothetical protein